MGKKEEYLAWCSAQVGTFENPAGSNNVPYNTNYYGYPVNDKNAHWCAAAVWDGMRQVGASDLYYGGGKTASCPKLLEYYKKNHPDQIVTEPRPGDWVFFDWDKSGVPDHIGTVEAVGKGEITTLEGNVDDAYRRLIRQRNDKILAYVRPTWGEDETPEPKPEAPEIVEPFVDVPKSAWYAKAVRWAYGNGVTSGTDATHFGPNKTITRAQSVQMLYKQAVKEQKEIKALEARIAALENLLKDKQ